MRCAHFLKALNAKLEQYATGGEAMELIEKKSSKRGGAKSSAEPVSTRVRGVERRPGGLQLMSVLGLTDAGLSKASIDLLRVTLKLSVASLTDLDLSFSFIGELYFILKFLYLVL